MRHRTALAILLAVLIAGVAAGAQKGSSGSLAVVRLAAAVIADGQPLAAGTYEVRLGAEEAPHGVGQSPGAEKWVEFVKDGKVAGREVATVISAADMKSIAKSPRPADNAVRVDQLAGGPYLRVWINRGGVNYLINLRTAR